MQIHSNPCFFRPGGGKEAQKTLPKDEGQVLEDGDVIGLLPETYYFKVIYSTINGYVGQSVVAISGL